MQLEGSKKKREWDLTGNKEDELARLKAIDEKAEKSLVLSEECLNRKMKF